MSEFNHDYLLEKTNFPENFEVEQPIQKEEDPDEEYDRDR